MVENEATRFRSGPPSNQRADYKAGDLIVDELPPIDFGRIAAQTASR